MVAQIERGLNDATVDDVPDLQPRSLDVLDDWTKSAMKLRDTASYRSSGEGIDDALIELQVHVATREGYARRESGPGRCLPRQQFGIRQLPLLDVFTTARSTLLCSSTGTSPCDLMIWTNTASDPWRRR